MEQFEARIFVLKLYKVLDGSSTFEDYVPSTVRNASRAKKGAAIAKGRGVFTEKQMQICYKLVSALDKQSVLYLRPYKGDWAQAWYALTKRFLSFERPRLQKLVSELTSLVKRDDESLIEYITRAEELQYNLNQVNEGLSEKNVHINSTERSTKQKRCHNCNKLGHIAEFCRSNNNRKPHNPQPSTSKVIQCYNCNKFGHIATECRNKKFESNARWNVRNEKQNLAKDEEYFSFFRPVDDEGVGLVLDPGATSHIINNREMFMDIDNSSSGKRQNANKTESEICGRGLVILLVKESNQVYRKIILENALFIPKNSRSLVSISHLRETGAEVLIGLERSIIDKKELSAHLGRRKNCSFGTLVRSIKLPTVQ